MATIAEIQLMKVSAFTAGVDNYAGIRQAGYRRNAQPTVGIRLEGELRPSRVEAVETDTPPFACRFVFSGPAPDALLDTTLPTATVTARDVTTASGTKTITYTNLFIKSNSIDVGNKAPGDMTYEADATNVVVSGI